MRREGPLGGLGPAIGLGGLAAWLAFAVGVAGGDPAPGPVGGDRAPGPVGGDRAVGAASGDRAVAAGWNARPILVPTRSLSLEPGETIPELFVRGGLSPREARRLVELMRPWAERAGLPPHTVARFHGWPDEGPDRVVLELDPDRRLVFEVEGAVWHVRAETVPVHTDTLVAHGIVRTSIWDADLSGDARDLSPREQGALVAELAGVFAWQLDFYRDPRPGDRFRIALARDVRPDGTLRGFRPLAAEYASADRRLGAYRFAASDEPDRPRFYDDEGRGIRGAFLKAPLDLVRVTSGFAGQRYHPVLGGYLAHRGIDYGAASGTPVRATGDGEVTRAGPAGRYGLMVTLRHPGGYETRYAHLGGIASGIRVGSQVRQGEPIGVVGSTGLSTAPHLHYEFRIRGRPVDPRSVDLPVLRTLSGPDRARFEASRDAQRVRLDAAAPWPPPPGSRQHAPGVASGLAPGGF